MYPSTRETGHSIRLMESTKHEDYIPSKKSVPPAPRLNSAKVAGGTPYCGRQPNVSTVTGRIPCIPSQSLDRRAGTCVSDSMRGKAGCSLVRRYSLHRGRNSAQGWRRNYSCDVPELNLGLGVARIMLILYPNTTVLGDIEHWVENSAQKAYPIGRDAECD